MVEKAEANSLACEVHTQTSSLRSDTDSLQMLEQHAWSTKDGIMEAGTSKGKGKVSAGANLEVLRLKKGHEVQRNDDQVCMTKF